MLRRLNLKSFILMYKEEFKGYKSSYILKDLMAGVSASIVALPLALALGISNGADESVGMKTAILGCIFISLLSGGRFQFNAATAATVSILSLVSVQYGIEAVFLCTLLCGVIMLLFSLIRIAKILEKIDKRVLLGLNTGIGLLVISGQLDSLFGTASTSGNIISSFISFFTLLPSFNITATAFGILTVVFIFLFPKKIKKFIPAQIIVFILAISINSIINADVQRISELPRVLDFTPSIPNFDNIGQLILPSFNIALILMIKSVSSVLSVGNQTKTPSNVNRELFALGAGNILMSFFSCIPAGASFSPIQVAIISGAKTRLAAVFHSISLLIILLAFAPLMTTLPLSVLAGILVHTGLVMIKKISLQNPVSLCTIALMLFFDISIAILASCLVAFLLSKYQNKATTEG